MFQEPGEYEPDWACLQCGKRVSMKEMEAIMEKQHEVEANNPKEHQIASESTNQPELSANPEPDTAPEPTRRERLDAARKLRGKKCQTCGHSYEHDEQHWCSLKKCPSRIPERNRLVYRPLPPGEGTAAEAEALHKVAKAPAESPSATKVDKGDHAIPSGFQITIIQLPASSNLPDLPAFDNTWPEMVQLRWLDTYRELARR